MGVDRTGLNIDGVEYFDSAILLFIFKKLLYFCMYLLTVGRLSRHRHLNVYFDSEGRREHYNGHCFCIED
jgi:hypothetical protein